MLANWTTQEINTLRLALAVTAGVMLAFLIAWPAAFICPIFISGLLSAEGPMMDGRKGVTFLAVVVLMLWLGQGISEFLILYPVTCTLVIIWLLFIGQFAGLSGVSPMLIVLLYLSVLMLPLMGMSPVPIVDSFVGGLFFSILLALVMAWGAYALIPERETLVAAEKNKVEQSKDELYAMAMARTLLVVPLFLVFYLFEMTGQLLVLLFVALLIQMPSAAVGAKGALAMIVANTVGGLAALVIYNVLVVAPSPVMLGLMVFAVSLWFGERVFSGSPTASLYGTGLSTVIVLLGSTTGAFGDEAGDKLYTRLLQILAAGLYIIAALSLLTDKGGQSEPLPAKAASH
ncbi:DUF2955 domain-containing protein [Oceanicoccus sagamiensis]|uniref:DUF2955 domain-containing protein n=1 Tax=Oceanicoccus sagamiensis TaxID=716816 RepID=A0A1X9NG32_9GAMM|nr:DUF2955 domain-containing protein [Oceanicoccus sagamiensis]ARN74825.1 hypothetical protein BST96_12275 [Oceanicoccus sagamiensis]